MAIEQIKMYVQNPTEGKHVAKIKRKIRNAKQFGKNIVRFYVLTYQDASAYPKRLLYE